MGMTDAEKALLRGGPALPDLSELPVRVPRDKGAELVTKYYFEVSPRSMERWPIGWRQVNGRAHGETAEIFAHAASMLAAAPVIMGGRRKRQKQAT